MPEAVPVVKDDAETPSGCDGVVYPGMGEVGA